MFPRAVVANILRSPRYLTRFTKIRLHEMR